MRTILLQLDTDPWASSFDRVVAVDAGVDELFAYAGVRPEDVTSLVHGAIFTRDPKDLKHTAIFVGGSNVPAGEQVLRQVRSTFFGPMRVSVMLDSNGSNTTAAAAVLCARKHIGFEGTVATVLGGTGPVGQRAAQLLALEGAQVRVASRTLDKAQDVCARLQVEGAGRFEPCATDSPAALRQACESAQVIVAAGAAGVNLLSSDIRSELSEARVLVDLNAVPPAGIAGVEVRDRAQQRDGAICYGAIGVGRLKMKIHKAALQRLFTSNDQVLETLAIYRLGESLA